MRLIDADALKERIKNKPKIVFDENVLLQYSFREVLEFTIKKYLEKVLWKIKNAPTVEAKPVVHGEWVLGLDEYDVEFGECSACKEAFYDSENDTFDIRPNFCPNCGADMRKKVE